MKNAPSRFETDMTTGPILGEMIRFAVPLMLSTVLQLLYSAADMVIVGRFAGSAALAAVGASSPIASLLVHLFMGLSVGANVVVAQHIGAGRDRDVAQSVHTSVALSLIGGIGIGLTGILLARPILSAIQTPSDVLDQAVVYMAIYFAGIPFSMLYNFCAAILRAVGDTRRPLIYLTVSGIANVVLNTVFVAVFRLGVAGVALATVVSEAISMVLVVRCLMREKNSVRLSPRGLRIYGDKLKQIVRVGLPAGLQSSMFSISNTIIQTALNGFGAAAIAGNTAAANIEGFVSMPMCGFYQAAMSFTGQCYGAKKPERIGRIARCAVLLIIGFGLTLGLITVCFARSLLRIYTTDAAVIEWGVIRMGIMVTTCFISDIGEVFVACLRGMGNSLQPMILSILGICGVRIVWIFTAFAAKPTPVMLYLCYPLSWLLTMIIHYFCYRRYKAKVIAALQTT